MKRFVNKIGKSQVGITLIALIVTIIVLLVLAGITITILLGDNGIISKTETAKEETNKQVATEKINFKITTAQMNTYVEKKRMPVLQELADILCEDNEIQYVSLETKQATLEKITIGDATSIYTKLKEYPYEFEINKSLQLASINGVKVSTNEGTSTVESEKVKVLEQTIESIEGQIEELNKTNQALNSKMEELTKTNQTLNSKTEELTKTNQTLSDKIEQLENTTQAEYKVGDEVVYSGYFGTTGWITSSKTMLYFSIRLDKEVSKDITGLEFSTDGFNVRHADGGYLINSVAMNTGANIGDYFKLVSVNGKNLTFSYKNATAFSTTNNTPLSVELRGLRLRFK